MICLPRISIVTPSFNQAEYLDQTIRSVIAQGYPNLEYLIFDGGSTDGSVEIIRRYHQQLAYWESRRDEGQTHAINKGLAHATGDILGWLNSDDLYFPGALAQVAHAFREHPDADLVVGAVEVIDAQGKPLRTHFGRVQSLEEVLDIYSVWWNGRQWVQPEVFFRRSLWEKVGRLSTRYYLAFDFEYWVRCFRAGAEVVSIPSVLARFRLHENQKSRAAQVAADEIRMILAEALATGAPIRKRARQRLGAVLGYDRFRLGQDGEGRPLAGSRPSVIEAVLLHPSWLIYVPMLQKRLCGTLWRRCFLGGWCISRSRPPGSSAEGADGTP